MHKAGIFGLRRTGIALRLACMSHFTGCLVSAKAERDDLVQSIEVMSRTQSLAANNSRLLSPIQMPFLVLAQA